MCYSEFANPVVGYAHDVKNIMAKQLPAIDVGSVDDDPPYGNTRAVASKS